MRKRKFREKLFRFGEYLLHGIGYVLMGILAAYITSYSEVRRYREYRVILKREHKTIKAYVYSGHSKSRTIYYRFDLNDTTYTGQSYYTTLGGIWPEEGDSINVYYSEKNPEINLWWWYCDGP